MRHFRDLLTLVALTACIGIAAASFVQAWRTGLPVAVADDHDDFVRILTAGRVVELPPDHRRRHARQLERELRRGVDWEADYQQLRGRKRRLLVENLVSLAELWLDEKMAEWVELPDLYQREQYLDGELRSLRNMKALQEGAFTAAMEEPGGLAKALAQAAAVRFERANDLRKSQLMGFAAAVRQRWAALGTQELLPPTGLRRD